MNYGPLVLNRRGNTRRAVPVQPIHTGDIIHFQDAYILVAGNYATDYYLLNVYNIAGAENVFCLDTSFLFSCPVLLGDENVEIQVDCTKLIIQPQSLLKSWLKANFDAVVATISKDSYYGIEELIKASPFIPAVVKKVFSL